MLLDIVMLLGAGALLGAVCERFRQSAIVGYLLAGALLGPNGLYLVSSGDEVLAVSELGVALLLFAIGLEFSWARLLSMGRIALGSGTLQVLGTAAVGTGVAALIGFGLPTALALGAIVALSSTASVLRTLTARGEVESLHGERALGILLVQDVAVVPFVLVVGVLAEGGAPSDVLVGIARTAAIGVALIAGLWVVFNHLVPRLFASGALQNNRELALLLAIVSGLGSSVAAHAVGISPALGAFVAGILLAESPFAIQVQADIGGLKTLMLTLFFTGIGMLSDPAWILTHAPLVAAALGVVIVGKVLGVLVSLLVFGARMRTALATGICLAQIGEFSFVLAGIARGRLLDEETFALVVSATILTMLLTPYLVGLAPRLAARLVRAPDPLAGGPTAAAGEVVIVIGFGPAGRAASERIAELGRPLVVVDQNPLATREARELGYLAITGDARYGEVLEHAGLLRAKVVIVTVPSTETALRVVRYVRQVAPAARTLVRARFHRSLEALGAVGAHEVIDEEHEVGRRIAEAYERFASKTDAPA